MPASSSEPAPITRYPLFTAGGVFFFRMTDQGIAAGPESLSFMQAGRLRIVPYRDIVEVNLCLVAMARAADRTQMIIRFRDGSRLVIMNVDAWGNYDAARTQDFYGFKADLHERLVAAGASHIRFTTGVSQARSQVLVVVLAVAGAVFLLLPLVLFFVTRQGQALLLMIGGAAFLYPAFRAADRNRPATYDPRRPPDMLA